MSHFLWPLSVFVLDFLRLEVSIKIFLLQKSALALKIIRNCTNIKTLQYILCKLLILGHYPNISMPIEQLYCCVFEDKSQTWAEPNRPSWSSSILFMVSNVSKIVNAQQLNNQLCTGCPNKFRKIIYKNNLSKYSKSQND